MSIKSTIAAVAASPFLLAGAAFAGPYVNVESNLSYPDGDYSSAATDVHIGYCLLYTSPSPRDRG